MIRPLLAAGDINDWVEILIVLVVVAASAFGKIAQWLIQYFNKSQVEKQQSLLRPRTDVSRRVASDRPVARPMPMAPGSRPVAAPFGERPRRSRTGPPPPVADMPTVLQEVLGEMLPRARTTQTRPTPPVAPRQHRAPVESRQRRTVVVRTTRVPSSRTPVVRKSTPSAAPPPQDIPRAESSPEHAEEHLGHLRSEVQARELAYEQAPDHLGHLQPHIRADYGTSVSDGAGHVRAWLGLQNRRSVRRGIVLSEVLGPPLALRELE